MLGKVGKLHVCESLRSQRMLTGDEFGEIRSRRARGEAKRKKHRTKIGLISAHFPMDRTLEEFDFSVISAVYPGRIEIWAA